MRTKDEFKYLNSREEKAKKIYEGFNRGLKIEELDLRDAIYFFEESNKPYIAIELSLRAGLKKEGLEIALRNNLFSYGSEIAKELGMKELSNELNLKQIDNYIKEEKFYLALDLVNRLGIKDKIKEIYSSAVISYTKQKKFYQLARLAEDLGYKQEAIDFYKKAEMPSIALFKQNENSTKKENFLNGPNNIYKKFLNNF